MLSVDLKNIKEGVIYLKLDLVDFIQKSSTYYLAIDKQLKPEDDSTFKVLTILKQLFTNWIGCVQSVRPNGNNLIYLPFDFADEYIGFLRVMLLPNGKFKVDYGYTEEIKGYSQSPSRISCSKEDELNYYEALSDSFECEQKAFLKNVEDVKTSIDKYLHLDW